MIFLATLKARVLGTLTGIAAQALAATIVVALIGGGLWWLRHDARNDERATCQADMSNAQIADLTQTVARQKESEALAVTRQAELELERDAARILADDLQGKLGPGKRRIVYPKEIVKALNR